jgi:hypothetical protein
MNDFVVRAMTTRRSGLNRRWNIATLVLAGGPGGSPQAAPIEKSFLFKELLFAPRQFTLAKLQVERAQACLLKAIAN